MLEADDVGAALQFLGKGQAAAGDPDFELCVGIETARCLHAELGDAPIQDAVVGRFRSGEPLLIDQDQAVVGEDEQIAEELDLETAVERWSIAQDVEPNGACGIPRCTQWVH